LQFKKIFDIIIIENQLKYIAYKATAEWMMRYRKTSTILYE